MPPPVQLTDEDPEIADIAAYLRAHPRAVAALLA